jgi:hypothetical protein
MATRRNRPATQVRLQPDTVADQPTDTTNSQTHALALPGNLMKLMLLRMANSLISMSLVATVMGLSSQLVSLVDKLKMQPLVLVLLKWINTSTTQPQSKIQRKLLILVTSLNDRVTVMFVKSASRCFASLLVFLID